MTMKIRQIAIVTLGTRDVQLKDGFQSAANGFGISTKEPRNGFCDLCSARSDGEKLLTAFAALCESIHLPIVAPFLNKIFECETSLDELLLICTDQPQAVRFSGNDTLFFAQIVEKWAKSVHQSRIKKITRMTLQGDLVNLDAMYGKLKDIEKQVKPDKSPFQVMLMAQGGIDAVNHALTLRCIEAFDNLKMYHLPEGESVKRVRFPELFKANLNKHITLQRLSQFDYATVAALNSPEDSELALLASYAFNRLNLNYRDAYLCAEQLVEKTQDRCFQHLQKEVALVDGKYCQDKLMKDLFISLKASFKSAQYATFIVRAFTLAENLFRPTVEQFLGGEIKHSPPLFPEWNRRLQNAPHSDTIAQSLIEFFEQKNENKERPIRYNEPNREVFRLIVEYVWTFNEKRPENADNLLCFSEKLEKLCALRNKVAHTLEPLSLNLILENYGSDSLDELFKFGNEQYKLKAMDDFGEFDKINARISKLLTS